MTDVDEAMEAGRPEKATVRAIWCDLVAEQIGHDPSLSPVYVTLCGSEGKDIELLIEKGLVHRTEVGAIAPEHVGRVVAIESRLQAILRIKKKFPGLRVIEQPIQNLVAGMDLTHWPSQTYEKVCRGLIINLDLNGSLRAQEHAGQMVFPVIRWAEKIARVHTQEPRFDWWLCLTLNATIDWTAAVIQAVQAFLSENFALSVEFGHEVRSHLGDEVFQLLNCGQPFDLAGLPADRRQRILMTLVPKRLASDVVAQGWRLETSRNLRYGGDGTAAPMVTWVFRFCRDHRASATP